MSSYPAFYVFALDVFARFLLILVAGLTLLGTGCGPKRSFDGPTVDAFTGRLTHNGKQVSFPEDKQVIVKVIHEKGNSWGIPIKSDGTFQVGWMPTGKYGAVMERPGPGGKGKSMYNVPGGLIIQEGQTEYTIELGKDWKP
jgi:hypothetical protein